jgi:hypothetical protein
MTRCIEPPAKMQQPYPEFGDATNLDSCGSAHCGPFARANLGFTRIADVGICRFRRLTCVVGSELRLCAVKQPRFSNNLSTFMSNCISVVTTLERNVSGRSASLFSHRRALCPVRTPPPHGAFFIAFMRTRVDWRPDGQLKCRFSNTT